MLGILVHGDNHFITRGPLPSPETARALARHWSLIRIGAVTPPALAGWQIVTRAFRENLEWAMIVPGERAMSPAVEQLLDELAARGIVIHGRYSVGQMPVLRLQPAPASVYAARLNLHRAGADLDIASFRPLLQLIQHPSSGALTYLTGRRFASALAGRTGLIVVTTADLRDCVPNGNTILLTQDHPRNTFYAIIDAARELGFFESLESYISPSAKISPTAAISPNVHVSDRAVIGAGAVLLPNTHVGPGVVVKPNAVIGGDGFETTAGKDRRIVAHAGGVWLEEGAQVGSCTCIDKGLFGDFTFVGRHTLIDNLVHFAHSARAGSGCSIIAGAEISGSVVLGDGVWVGPNAAINQGLNIGAHSYIGTGSVVTRDLDPHSLAYGSPAKRAAWVCECRVKLAFESGSAECECGKRYILSSDRVQPA